MHINIPNLCMTLVPSGSEMSNQWGQTAGSCFCLGEVSRKVVTEFQSS